VRAARVRKEPTAEFPTERTAMSMTAFMTGDKT
jgi:hypothetical protein